MVTNNHYRWDFIGLSTDTKPTPENSEKVVDGSTFYCSDTSKLYVYCKDNWYERKPLGEGGGGSPTVVQTTGTSITDVMSQDATTKMIYPDIVNYPYKIMIGEGDILGKNKGVAINGTIASGLNSNSIAIGAPDGSFANIGSRGRSTGSIAIGADASVGMGNTSVSIGQNAYCNSGHEAGDNVAIGSGASAGNNNVTGTVALGSRSKPTRQGEVNVGNTANKGFNNTAYRVIGGVHDGQLPQDAVTVAQVNATIDAINTALSTNIPHIGA